MCSVQTFYPLTHQHAKNNLWIFWILRHVIERSPFPRHLTPLYFSLAEDNDDQCAPGGGWRHVQRLRQRGRGPGPRHCRPRVWLGIPGEDFLLTSYYRAEIHSHQPVVTGQVNYLCHEAEACWGHEALQKMLSRNPSAYFAIVLGQLQAWLQSRQKDVITQSISSSLCPGRSEE